MSIKMSIMDQSRVLIHVLILMAQHSTTVAFRTHDPVEF